MEYIYEQIGWGMWKAGENHHIGHPNRLESLNIYYSIKGENRFVGLGVDDLGIFEFDGEVNQTKIDFTKMYKEETMNFQAIKGKVNYDGKKFYEGYKGKWKGNEKSGLFTFISGDIEKTEVNCKMDLTKLTMLEITQEKLGKLDRRFRTHLKEMPFTP